MKNYFIGIDQSLNSSGICILTYEDNKLKKEYFTIVKTAKLNKKEIIAEESNKNFKYNICENIVNLKEYENDNHLKEFYKTKNFIAVLDKIYEIIKSNVNKKNANIYIVQEGISYGSSLRTKSIFDLAGLNYMLRYKLLEFSRKFDNFRFWIIPPTEIKKFATGKGNANKEFMIATFKAIYPKFDLPKIDDVCDAYFMARYAKKLSENIQNNE